jgi:hypothetical protein
MSILFHQDTRKENITDTNANVFIVKFLKKDNKLIKTEKTQNKLITTVQGKGVGTCFSRHFMQL